jgi:hypothetical protein
MESLPTDVINIIINYFDYFTLINFKNTNNVFLKYKINNNYKILSDKIKTTYIKYLIYSSCYIEVNKSIYKCYYCRQYNHNVLTYYYIICNDDTHGYIPTPICNNCTINMSDKIYLLQKHISKRFYNIYILV